MLCWAEMCRETFPKPPNKHITDTGLRFEYSPENRGRHVAMRWHEVGAATSRQHGASLLPPLKIHLQVFIVALPL